MIWVLSSSPSSALSSVGNLFAMESGLRLPLVGKRVFVAICGFVIIAAACLAQSSTGQSSASGPASGSSKTKKKSTKRTRGSSHAKKRGQQKIDNARTQAIQEALIREHYLKGEPSGKFDASTQKALEKYQADHGWQTKVVPDSRALISLGLGPDHDHLLNPETAMTSSPAKPHAAPPTDQSDGQSQTQNH
jgi:peptidoglycan hydrolase-like protein with peptidoglycan-binding domain